MYAHTYILSYVTSQVAMLPGAGLCMYITYVGHEPLNSTILFDIGHTGERPPINKRTDEKAITKY